jgi:cystathionine beta-lyase family protein involved in aluminum resistance
LRPGDELLAVAGHPYDTLEEVIGVRGVPNAGSLCDFGVSYRVLELTSSGNVDFEALQMAIRPGMDLIVHICNGNYAIAWLYGADYY